MHAAKLFENQTTNGDSAVLKLRDYITASSEVRPNLTMIAQGTWDGATITMTMSADGGITWHPMPTGTSKTSDGQDWTACPAMVDIKLTVSGAGAGTDLDCWVFIG